MLGICAGQVALPHNVTSKANIPLSIITSILLIMNLTHLRHSLPSMCTNKQNILPLYMEAILFNHMQQHHISWLLQYYSIQQWSDVLVSLPCVALVIQG